MNVYQRINAVMQKVEYIKKDAEVQGYKVVTHDNVTAVLRPHLVGAGIVVHVEQKTGRVIKEWETRSGSKFHRYSGDYAVSFVNIEDPNDRLTVTAQAQADDNADKAPGKAMSYATKYAMLKTFSLETGENEEGRYSEAPPFTDLQKDQFHELVEKGNALGLACFAQEIGPDAMGALNGTFPRGQVSAGKKRVKELESEGWDTIRSYAEQIKERLEACDPSVLELTDELQGSEKRLVANLLTDGEVAKLRELKTLEAA